MDYKRSWREGIVMKMLVVAVLYFLMVIAVSHAPEASVKILCVTSGGVACTPSTTCSATVYNATLDGLVANRSMTFLSDGFYNITIINSTGKYSGFATCTSGGESETIDISFEILSDDMAELAMVVGMTSIAGLFIFMGTKMQGREYFQILFMGMGLLVVVALGASLMDVAAINAFTNLQNISSGVYTATLWTAVVTIAFFSLKMVVTRLQDLTNVKKRKNTDEDSNT